MIDRYSLPDMEKLWNDETRFKKMLDIEIYACEALVKERKMPQKELQNILKKAKIEVEDIQKREEVVHHETVAFLESISCMVGPSSSKYLHYGLTSSDALDTALSLVMRDSLDLIIKDTQLLRRNLLKKARKYKDLVVIGRTHGVHAEPMTLGLKFLNWVYEADRCIERLKSARESVSYGKISGSVGTYANVEPFVEKYVCRKLRLKPAKISSQILQRDIHSDYLYSITILGNLLERIAMEIRHLHRTEIQELCEPFSKGQKGSSSMPHKKNPILCERICGLARVLRGNLIIALEDTALWGERDMSHSSAERVILPDSSGLVYYMLKQMNFVIENVVVNKENIKKNLEMTKGDIFSQALMLRLLSKGIEKEKAYKLMQEISFKSGNFVENVLGNKEVMGVLKKEEISDIEGYRYFTKNIEDIFERF